MSDVRENLAGILVRRFGAQDPETVRDLEEFVLEHLGPDRKMGVLELLHAESEAELGALL